jgi:hypothetical protein
MNLKQQEFVDVPLFELSTFTIYEINKIGLDTMMIGTRAFRYTNRYSVDNINYTDNTQEYIANMKANNGVYKNDILTLRGDVVYTREDGLVMQTSKAIYNKKSSVTTIDNDYVSYRGSNRVIGSWAKYNNKLNKIASKNVIAKYQIKEN